MSTDKQVKAFIVETDDPEDAVIRFATTNVAARRYGANEIGCDFNQVSCKRMPWADKYAETGIPHSAFIANGFWYSCATCGETVDSDTESPAYGMDLVFCCENCKDAEVADRKAEADRRQACVDAARTKFPGITEVRGWARNDQQEATFLFPGGTFAVTWVVGEETVHVAQVDVTAWNAWRSTRP